MRGLGIIFLFPLFLGLSPVTAGVSPADTNPAACKDLARQWAEAVGSNRADALEAVLDEAYVHIHGTGLVESRATFLEALRSGTRQYQPLQLEDLVTRVIHDTALVTGKFRLKVEVRGKVLEGVNRFCLTMVKGSAGWKVVQFQATALAVSPGTPGEEKKAP